MAFKYKPVGPTKRPYKPRPKKTKTCPVCANTFTGIASKRFCSDNCRKYNHTGEIPKVVLEKAAELRSKRTQAAAERKAKREANAKLRAEHKAEQDLRRKEFIDQWDIMIGRDRYGSDGIDYIEDMIAQRNQAYLKRFGEEYPG